MTFPLSSPSLLILFSNLPLRCINRPPDAVLDLPFLQLRLNIIHNRLSHSRSKDPIQDTPRSEIPLRTTEQVHIRPAGNSTQEEARGHDRIAGVRERLLDGDGG